MGTRTDAQTSVRGWDIEIAEEHVRQKRIVVLAGVHDDVFYFGVEIASTDDGAKFDELGPRADDAHDPHAISLSYHGRRTELRQVPITQTPPVGEPRISLLLAASLGTQLAGVRATDLMAGGHRWASPFRGLEDAADCPAGWRTNGMSDNNLEELGRGG